MKIIMKKTSVLAVLSFGIALAGLLCVAMAIGSWYTEAAVRHTEAPMERIRYDYPPGVSAIQPSRHVTDPSQAAYGRAEVEQYLASNPRLMRGVPGGPSPKLGTVEFLPAREAGVRSSTGRSIGRPDDALVCWVELIGPFDVSKSVSIPPFLARKSGPLSFAPAPKQILVFDAQTGNLLLSYYDK
jgi:hypothetical protein